MKVCRVCKRNRSVGSNTLGVLAAAVLQVVRDGEEEEEAGVAGGEGGR